MLCKEKVIDKVMVSDWVKLYKVTLSKLLLLDLGNQLYVLVNYFFILISVVGIIVVTDVVPCEPIV